jgi:hypothetical protein
MGCRMFIILPVAGQGQLRVDHRPQRRQHVSVRNLAGLRELVPCRLDTVEKSAAFGARVSTTKIWLR